jgi:dipeptidyl aminopeptidase/acylaminoacyl peptidase
MYEKIFESRPRRDIAIYLHGGPAMEVSALRKSVDYFDPILSQGLRVLCISYAGSLSFGDEYAKEVIGAQGRRDLCDVEETIKAFPGKIACVFGGSYGGFLSLHAFCKIPLNHVPCFAALYPYVSSRGCASESGDFAWEQEYTGSKTVNEWPIPKKCLDPDVVPLLYSADVVEKPLLLLHGDKDDVCPLSQSQVVFHILRQRGNDKVELVKFAGEGHGFKKSVKKISMEKISNFIKKHCDKV